jgi:hypothetical protein
LVIRVDSIIGPKPVWVSRATTLATIAVVASMKKTLKMMCAVASEKGAFLSTLPPEPIWTFGVATAPKASRPKTMAMTQKAGWRSW